MRKVLIALAAVVILVPTTAYATHVFDDVEDGRFYAEPVEWAFDNGITTGRTADIFDPEAPVTRGESVTFLKRYHDAFVADDTLSGLDCADGQVAIEDDGWRCADVVLETVPAGLRTAQSTIRGNPFHPPTVAIGANGLPLITQYDNGAGDLELFVCATTDCSFGTHRDLVTAGDAGEFASIIVPDNGRPLIAHDAGGQLRVFACEDATCSIGTDHTLDTVASPDFISMQMGSSGTPLIAYQHSGDEEVRIFECTETDCSNGGSGHGSSRTLVTEPNSGWYLQMAISADGNPLIVHRNEEIFGELHLYACSTANCSAGANHELVANGQNNGIWASIAVGPNGRPIIVHQQSDSDDLALFVCAANDCSTGGIASTLVSDGVVGGESAIAIGGDGLPVITYHDEDDDDLVVVRCNAADCSTTETVQPVATVDTDGRLSAIGVFPDGSLIIVHGNVTDDHLDTVVFDYDVVGVSFE